VYCNRYCAEGSTKTMSATTGNWQTHNISHVDAVQAVVLAGKLGLTTSLIVPEERLILVSALIRTSPLSKWFLSVDVL